MPKLLGLELLLWTLFLFSSGVMSYDFDGYDIDNLSNDCALVLKRSSSTLSTDLFKDDDNRYELQEEGTGNCIRNEDINEALRDAKRYLGYTPGYVDPQNINVNEIDRIANVITETTRNLAEKFRLTHEEINYALPTIDTSKTDLWDMCPDVYKPTPCTASRFRTFDGQCTSLKHSVIGMARTAFKRFLPPQFADGISAPKVSPIDGKPLPHVRKISIKVHPDISQLTEVRSIMHMSWGQFFAHDLTLADFPREDTGEEVFCCTKSSNPRPNCMPIILSEKDPFYSRYNSTCMEFQRTLVGVRPGCALGPRITNNFVTSRIDANFVYGNSEMEARRLRLGKKGLMKTWPKFRDLGLKDLLPPLTERPNLNCLARPRNKFCFLTGDSRASFHPQLNVLHIIYVREHNRIAKELGYLNPHWDDERIFQETRHIMAAGIQHIAYNEFLPLLIGPKYMQMFNLTLQKEGYWYGYDEKAQIGTDLAIQTAAFRFGHTVQPNKFRLYNKHHKFVDSWELQFIVIQPFPLYQPGIIDKVLLGAVDSQIQDFDRYMVSGLSKHLFQPPTIAFGRDLASLNINRGRDHAMPGYNDFREWCGLPRAKTFEELDYYLGNETAFQFSKIYQHPDEIDLWSACISEYPVEGGIVGPTFACIIANQQDIHRRGDRFWYENPGYPSSFTPGQLQEIRKIVLAKIVCENSDDIPTIQLWTMLMPDRKNNPRYFCKDLPQMNLDFWIEDPDTKEFKYKN